MARFDNMIKAVYCVKCGADITQSLKFYPEGKHGGRYCYDCKVKWEKKHKQEKRKEKDL